MDTRTGKQCRERYINHLDPDMKKTAWTVEEDDVIRELFPELGTKWSQYMVSLPGRSDNAIKNRYHVISRNNFDSSRSRSDTCSEITSTGKRSATECSSSDETDAHDDSSSESFVEVNRKRLKRLHSARNLLDRKIRELEVTRSFVSSSPSPSDSSDISTTFCDTDLVSEFGSDFDGFDFDWTDADSFLSKESESQGATDITDFVNTAFDFSCYEVSV